MKRVKKIERSAELKSATAGRTAGTYQHALDGAAHGDVHEGIRQGLEDARKGRTRSIEEFFREFEAAHGISR